MSAGCAVGWKCCTGCGHSQKHRHYGLVGGVQLCCTHFEHWRESRERAQCMAPLSPMNRADLARDLFAGQVAEFVKRARRATCALCLKSFRTSSVLGSHMRACSRRVVAEQVAV